MIGRDKVMSQDPTIHPMMVQLSQNRDSVYKPGHYLKKIFFLHILKVNNFKICVTTVYCNK